jgi:hypothetical protein
MWQLPEGTHGPSPLAMCVTRANSESVKELAEEGQSFEAEVLAGVEEAEVITHEVLEDDVPSEYDGER